MARSKVSILIWFLINSKISKSNLREIVFLHCIYTRNPQIWPYNTKTLISSSPWSEHRFRTPATIPQPPPLVVPLKHTRCTQHQTLQSPGSCHTTDVSRHFRSTPPLSLHHQHRSILPISILQTHHLIPRILLPRHHPFRRQPPHRRICILLRFPTALQTHHRACRRRLQWATLRSSLVRRIFTTRPQLVTLFQVYIYEMIISDTALCF